MNQAPETSRGDMVLPPGLYAYIQSETNGTVKTHVGPSVPTMQAQDRPVKYDPHTRTFRRVSQEDAMTPCVIAGEGDYVILENPSKDDSHPHDATGNPSPNEGLRMGSRDVISGPCSFALWPGQSAKVLQGHNLRSNQFLLVRVYNEEAAKKNWGSGVQKKAPPQRTEGDETETETEVKEASVSVMEINAEDLRLGQRIIIRGNEVSFYIPPTGIEVILDDLRQGRTPNEGEDRHVREAVTLERLEYCVLIEENGDKRYEKGPAVVFPSPTERFHHKNGKNKFKAIEMTGRSGLHIKVIAAHHDDETDMDYKPGDELFITGSEPTGDADTIQQAIYYPRPEHSIVRYGEQEQHFATAIPVGEGRYLMNRDSGVIDTKKGPDMLLPDPRSHVIVRRILSDKEVELWYPGNREALEYNQNLRLAAEELNETMAAIADLEEVDDMAYSNRGDVVSEQGLRSRRTAKSRRSSMSSSAAHPRSADAGLEMLGAMAGDEFARKTKYTQPRTVTLDTKFDGVPRIDIWTGYAVMVVDRQGHRKVRTGPDSVLLNYDESLEILSISTGKPKNTDHLKRTVYLRVLNNKVSDIIGKTDSLETKDHARVEIKISLMVNFEDENPETWFQAENYVKLLCDHVRSVLKGVVQKMTIEDLYSNHVAVVRDAILGKSVKVGEDSKPERPGMRFSENGMVIRDVEVLDFTIRDDEIAELLSGAQFKAVKSNVEIQEAQKKLELKLRQEEIAQQTAKAEAQTKLHQLDLQSEITDKTLDVNKAEIEAEKQQSAARKEANEASQEAENVQHEWTQKRQKSIDDRKLEKDTADQQLALVKMEAEVKAIVARFEAGKEGMAEALTALNRDEVLMKVAQATSVQAMIGGDNFVEAFQKMFNGTPLATLGSKIALLASKKDTTAPE